VSFVGVSREANVQRLHLERIFTTAKHEGWSGKDFVKRILEIVEEWIESVINDENEVTYTDIRGFENTIKIPKRDLDSLLRVRDYVLQFLRNHSDLLTQEDILANLRPGSLNVLDLSGFDENQMRIIVSYILRHILKGRQKFKRGNSRERAYWMRLCPAIVSPILIVIEEGHIFAPKGEENDVVRWMSKIAREGRKFGVGLGIVSQRPKKLNDDILSQCNTKIVLRIVEPTDQRYVQQASEQISEDLLNDIASLGKGEAVIVGSAVKLPVAVKIRKFRGEYGGGDIDVVGEWGKMKKEWEEIMELSDLDSIVR
jgi:DNA helicase HerA-like ATPase